MDQSLILEETIAPDLMPMRKGGITLYPASSLDRILRWAELNGRTLEWLEGAFYDTTADKGQLSSRYICERGADYAGFKEKCLSLVDEIQAEAGELGTGAYFEIGVSPPP